MLFSRDRRTVGLVGGIALAVLAGCTSPAPTAITPSMSPSLTQAPTPTETATPTVTPTWDADQTAAVRSVEEFIGTSMRILADPSAFTSNQTSKLLSSSSGGDALSASVGSFDTMREKGFRVLGSVELVRTLPTRPVDESRGREVHVTVCLDQSSLRAVDQDGNTVSDERYQYPDYLLRQFSVRRPLDGESFLVFGFQTINGACP